MINSSKKLYILIVLLVVLAAACSSEPDGANSDNANVAQPAVAQNGTPQPTSGAAVPAAATPDASAAQPQPNGAANPKAQIATKADQPADPAAASGKFPKLEVPVIRLDFGKQPKEKSLSRSFVIKNTGTAELKIAAVEPS